MAAKCVCTGFALVNNYGTWQPADLFIVGNVYVANAYGGGITAEQGVPWSFQASYNETGKHFERRNVYVFSPDELIMNPAMQEYIGQVNLLKGNENV